jgi:hypothetical protein
MLPYEMTTTTFINSAAFTTLHSSQNEFNTNGEPSLTGHRARQRILAHESTGAKSVIMKQILDEKIGLDKV